MTRDMTPRGALISVATAIALSRGGMTLHGPLIQKLAEALEAVPPVLGGDGMHPVMAPARAVIDARLAGDANAYSEAAYDLAGALCVYWDRLALRGAA